MKDPIITPVLLCGGVGSRLWPVSRELYPKQFLSMTGGRSMLEETLLRTSDLNVCPPVVVCNDEHRFLVAEQLRQVGITPEAIILEPTGRNTAPAIALAALHVVEQDSDSLLLALPADHLIEDKVAFTLAVKAAAPLAEKDKIVTFGVVPKLPETGYGYVRCGPSLGGGCFSLDRFVEKPDAATAKSYLEKGNYLWNSGMFLMKASVYLNELAKFQPDILEHCRESIKAASHDMNFTRPETKAFEMCPSDSVDYAVMEHTTSGAVVSLDCGWSDVGAWTALWDVGVKDETGNVCKGDVLLDDTRDSYFHSESRLVAASGVDNLVVVETPDAIMVAHKNRAQGVKNLVAQLKKNGRSEVKQYAKVYRPWGSYETLVCAGRFQVKRIIVNPGQQLSLQMHHHRAEHWVVVEGTAEVTCDDIVQILGEDQSTYIPLGEKHRLANHGKIPLEVIEVQSGSYLGEDDIVRFEDAYGRDSIS